jgi:phosphoribosylaminoimidazole-succinocarboxamide synthase
MRGVTDRSDGQPVADPGPMPDPHTELARRLGVLPSNVTHTTKPTLIN